MHKNTLIINLDVVPSKKIKTSEQITLVIKKACKEWNISIKLISIRKHALRESQMKNIKKHYILM